MSVLRRYSTLPRRHGIRTTWRGARSRGSTASPSLRRRRDFATARRESRGRRQFAASMPTTCWQLPGIQKRNWLTSGIRAFSKTGDRPKLELQCLQRAAARAVRSKSSLRSQKGTSTGATQKQLSGLHSTIVFFAKSVALSLSDSVSFSTTLPSLSSNEDFVKETIAK